MKLRKGQKYPTQPRGKHRKIRDEWEEIQKQWFKLMSILVWTDDKVQGNYLSQHFGDSRQPIRTKLQEIDTLLRQASALFRAIREEHSQVLIPDEEIDRLQQQWLDRYGSKNRDK